MIKRILSRLKKIADGNLSWELTSLEKTILENFEQHPGQWLIRGNGNDKHLVYAQNTVLGFTIQIFVDMEISPNRCAKASAGALSFGTAFCRLFGDPVVKRCRKSEAEETEKRAKAEEARIEKVFKALRTTR